MYLGGRSWALLGVVFWFVLVLAGGVSVCVLNTPRQFQDGILLDKSSKGTISLLPKFVGWYFCFFTDWVNRTVKLEVMKWVQEKQLLIRSFICSLVLLSSGLIPIGTDGLCVGYNRSPRRNPDVTGSCSSFKPPVMWLHALLGGQQLDTAKRRREESCLPNFWLHGPTSFLCQAPCSWEAPMSRFNLLTGLKSTEGLCVSFSGGVLLCLSSSSSNLTPLKDRSCED